MHTRELQRVLTARPASDGGGVKLYRIVGPDNMRGLDPFLMLDELGSSSPDDYIAGFPPHPHRGFETVTYMLEGKMLHEDHLGNRDLVTSGGVQWMTAGRGVIHSEMPQQVGGRMHGFQLWVNLPAAEKMKDPVYRSLAAEEIPIVSLPGGGRVKVIAGRYRPVGSSDGETLVGPVSGVGAAPLYLDLELTPNGSFGAAVDPGDRVLVYLYEGRLHLAGRTLKPRQMAVLGDGDTVELGAADTRARALLLAARPLREPVAYWGPFVMSTRAEVERAIADYEAGRLAA
jgi:redox-sensitive bicupin YhaK (pirin superfamily)